jgi:phosphomannomutase
MDVDALYRCPGETYEISRSVHLGRLASFYPACGDCQHRTDTASFSGRRARLISELQRHSSRANPTFDAEGLSGVFLNEIGPDAARRVGQALGICLAHMATAAAESSLSPEPGIDAAPRVLIAHDGRPSTSELAAAAADGLRWASSTTIDLGAATAPGLVLAAEREQIDGAVLVSNPSGEPQHVGIALWAAFGEPMSSPGALDAVKELFPSPATRPRSAPTGHERMSIDEQYLAQLEPHFHALRPLRIVVNTTSPVLTRYLERLSGAVAIEIDRGFGHVARAKEDAKQSESPAISVERLQKIADRVRSIQAHFGIWIDGDGESCRVIDQRGELVPVELLAAMIVRELLMTEPATKVVISAKLPALASAAKKSGAQVIRVANTRQAIWTAIRQHEADFAADDYGRIWFTGQPVSADALKVLTLVLTLMSRSDRPLSELIASAIL